MKRQEMLRNLKVVSQMVVKCDFYHIHITFFILLGTAA